MAKLTAIISNEFEHELVIAVDKRVKEADKLR